jgi:hypothetical protein
VASPRSLAEATSHFAISFEVSQKVRGRSFLFFTSTSLYTFDKI